MSVKYEHYTKIKDSICILYAGHCTDYLIILKLIRPILETQFPGLKICLACRDDLFYLLKDETNTTTKTILKNNVHKYGYIKEIEGRMRGVHPIMEMLEESGLSVPVVSNECNSLSNLCCIFTEGSLPTRSMPEAFIKQCESKARFNGYDVWVNPNIDTVSQAGWVISVEQAALYKAASDGVKTTLVATGIGTKLYQKMFPKGEIWKI